MANHCKTIHEFPFDDLKQLFPERLYKWRQNSVEIEVGSHGLEQTIKLTDWLNTQTQGFWAQDGQPEVEGYNSSRMEYQRLIFELRSDHDAFVLWYTSW